MTYSFLHLFISIRVMNQTPQLPGPELCGFFLWISCSVHFPCYLQHFGAGSCDFIGICNILEFEPLIFHNNICNILVLQLFMLHCILQTIQGSFRVGSGLFRVSLGFRVYLALVQGFNRASFRLIWVLFRVYLGLLSFFLVLVWWLLGFIWGRFRNYLYSVS